ncbi:MAG: hypothetical protein KDB18_14365, partial [Salinibacterium sp.]|nr:hypothetical protein [Salinibacterium sp.]
ASDLAASLDGQLIWLGTGDRLVRWSLDERPPRPRLVANLPGPIESLHLDALEEQVLVWARSMDGRLRPHRIASGADTSVSVDSQEWICGSGFIDTGTRCMALARTDPDHFQLYEVAFEGPAPHTRRHGPVLHVPGLLGACLAADDQGVVLALTIEGPEGTTRKLQLLNALGDLLAEMPLTGLATPRCRLGRGGREVWLQTGDGALYSIPRQGGLPLRIRLDGLGAAFGVELEP